MVLDMIIIEFCLIKQSEMKIYFVVFGVGLQRRDVLGFEKDKS